MRVFRSQLPYLPYIKRSAHKINALRKLFTILIVLLGLNSCGHNIDQNTIDRLDEYKTAKEVLFNNFDKIKTAVGYQYNENTRQGNHSTIISSNRYHIKNTVAKNNTELKKLLTIWDDELICNHKVFGKLSLNKDSILTFTTDYDNGTFSGIGHYIVYNPTNDNSYFEKYENEILEIKNLKNNWFYLIQKHNYVD